MHVVLLILAANAAAWAADVPMQFVRMDLLDGRTLTNVVVKSYDAATDNLLLVADGNAMLVPANLIPPPLAERLKAGAPAAGSTTNVITPPTIFAPEFPEEPASASKAPVANASGAPDSDQVLARHKEVAQAHVRRYFQYEFKADSKSISVTTLDIEMDQPEAITGWLGRYRTKGKAFLELYDRKGGSYSRTTSSFEVITEQKPGQPPTVVDFTRL
jgi:hypothetical protein